MGGIQFSPDVSDRSPFFGVLVWKLCNICADEALIDSSVEIDNDVENGNQNLCTNENNDDPF